MGCKHSSPGNVLAVALVCIPISANGARQRSFFRNHQGRVSQRSSCAENEARTWDPEWDKDWARQRVDLEGYRARTQVWKKTQMLGPDPKAMHNVK
eukprot:1155150-Pelagomonas_calceolata.AAC.23